MRLKNIKSQCELSETMSVYSDSDAYGGNSIFKIKIEPLSDLAGGKGTKRGKNDPAEITGDYQTGDIVRGIGEEDRDEHEGPIISINYHDENTEEVVGVSIESNGRIVKLIPSTIDMVKDKGAANALGPSAGEEAAPNMNTDLSQYTYENIQRWDNFAK